MPSVTAPSVTTRPLAQEFEEIFRKHYQLVYRTAWRVTGTPEDAEDVSQTIFLRLLRREFPPDLTKNPKSYLYRAAVNLSLDTIRLRQRETLLGGESKRIGAQQDSASASSDEELHRQLYEAIAELNPGAAHILLLRYVHSYSDAEIAKLLGTSRGTIAVSLFRSRARLKKLIRASLGEK